ncbi:sensor histidine kinase [Streptomyces sp. NPDC002564]|uniref:sensor histidine kinase n=1 Tax=Streptomyces sp. NPDC002564 TaxID=3364649 RepID=UPI0036A8FF6C
MKASTAVRRRPVGEIPEAPVVAAALLALAAAGEVLLRADGRVPLPLALSLALGATAPVAVLAAPPRPADGHRTVAAAALTTGTAALLALTPFHVLTAAGAAALLLALHRAGRRAPRALAALLPLPFVGYAIAAPGGAGTRILAAVLAAGAAAAAGSGLARRARDTALAHRATERAVADTLLAHAARGERARIARELHDVVAHHISLIAVQAETARLTTPGLPAAGAERFLAIGDTARTALTEMRRLLGVLREDAGPAATPERRPQPGIEQLGDLVDEARDASGGALRLIVEGPMRPLDPGVGLTAYRIVQEALTNARRHAPGAAIDVELRYGNAELRLRVRDNGPGPHPAAHGAGHGLLGMRERAATAGGALRAGPARDGGFLIEATFPTAPREQAA